ncbi:alanine racemase [Defluviicoccus vanus]|uniref:Alanine racemase n=1 Tax=Defluviicoccus vanus TaxID=111831 RepID=A0A7H1MYN2_9PROT|nr:alanine racemase [Defluviicoccus vanus]QNT68568.1 alanine racemase [Defluviicoccus vanus]
MSTTASIASAVLTIDLDAIVANWRWLQAMVSPAECAAVVKANAYGLGVAAVAPALAAADCRTFFVSSVDEGIHLRCILGLPPPAKRHRSAKSAAIYLLNGLISGCEADLTAHELQPVLNSLAEIDAWTAHARRLDRPLPAAIQVDTGMSRLGLPPEELAIVATDRQRLQGIQLTAIVSHLACAEAPSHHLNALQLSRFRDALTRLPPARPSLANSSGILLGTDYHGRLVRPGIALYGGAPRPEEANPMQPVLRLEGRVLQVRTIDAATTVGYGATHQSARRERIATVAVGYADGYLRSLSSRGTGYIGDRPVPLVGRVSMDLITFDVSGLPEADVRPGTPIELIGPHHSVDAVASDAGTIAYEILTSLGSRYRRVYTRSGA